MFRKFKRETELRKLSNGKAVTFKGFLITCQLTENSSSFLPGDFPMFINPLIPTLDTNTQIHQCTNAPIQNYTNPTPLDTLTKTAARLPAVVFNCPQLESYIVVYTVLCVHTELCTAVYIQLFSCIYAFVSVHIKLNTCIMHIIIHL